MYFTTNYSLDNVYGYQYTTLGIYKKISGLFWVIKIPNFRFDFNFLVRATFFRREKARKYNMIYTLCYIFTWINFYRIKTGKIVNKITRRLLTFSLNASINKNCWQLKEIKKCTCISHLIDDIIYNIYCENELSHVIVQLFSSLFKVIYMYVYRLLRNSNCYQA